MVISLRILVEGCVEGYVAAVQRGRGAEGRPGEMRVPIDGQLTFHLTLEVRSLDGPVAIFKGPAIQKDSKGEFIYLGWYLAPIQPHPAPAGYRAKIYLNQLVSEAVKTAIEQGRRATLRVPGRAKGGHPACATLPAELVWE